ncbi:MAG: hypothetical protein ACK4Z8_05005 [Novosphingobium sp.]
MFDTSEVIAWRGHFYICRHCRTDYRQGSPLIEKLNPLRYEIGFRLSRNGPLIVRFNRKGALARKWSNLIYRISQFRKGRRHD